MQKVGTLHFHSTSSLKSTPSTESYMLARIHNSSAFHNDLEQLEGILAYKTLNHEILYCNKKFLKYIGYDNINKVNGKTDYDLIWQEHTNIYHQQEKDAISGHMYSALHPGRDVNGRFFLFFNRKYPWFDDSGKIIGIISYSIEIEDPYMLELGCLLKKQEIVNSSGVHYIGKNNIEFNLSQREEECLFYIIRGKTAKNIAKIFNISPRTVETYIERLKVKFNCNTRADLIEAAIKIGFMNVVPGGLLSRKLTDSLQNK